MDPSNVLVVGGGPVGLTLAIELGRRGVSVRARRQAPGRPGGCPKMERCNARTMENFRRLGIADAIRAAGLDTRLPMDVFICVESVTRAAAGAPSLPLGRRAEGAHRATNDGSLPLEPYQLISQYTLEPLLREVAEPTPGVDVRFGARAARLHAGRRRRHGPGPRRGRRERELRARLPRRLRRRRQHGPHAARHRAARASRGSSCARRCSAATTCSSASRSARAATTTSPTTVTRS